jgi:hypothetical protein
MMKIEIKYRFTDNVLFEHTEENNTKRLTLEAAVAARSNLGGAYLEGAYLAHANLAGAYLEGAYLAHASLAHANLKGASLAHANFVGAHLEGAYLEGANLKGASLAHANLVGAYLKGANLAHANLAGAYLEGAYLEGANLEGAFLDDDACLIGERPILQIGPIGSRCAYCVAYITDKGLRLRVGCFFGTKAELALVNTHDREYRAVLAMIDAHAEIWTPKDDSGSEARKFIA